MSKKILLSTVEESVLERLKDEFFGEDSKIKKVAFMPSDGANIKEKYIRYIEDFVTSNGAEFIVINNSLRREEAKSEITKLRDTDALLISGGNTYVLLDHLRKSGFDKAIIELSQREDYIIAGYSAGALVLTPTIKISGEMPDPDENGIGLEDLTGLGIVDVEVCVHYEADQASYLEKYASQAAHEVITIANDGMVIL